MSAQTIMPLKKEKPLVPLQPNQLPQSLLAAQLGISPRHLRRIRSQSFGPRIAWNRISDNDRQIVISLKQENSDFNCQWISELASDRLERYISQSSVWRILKQAGLLKPTALVRIPRSRFEVAGSGEVVQLDTSWGYWLNGKKLCLILLLDDYSRFILAAQFFFEDTAYSNMLMIREVVEKYGAFKLLYTDNASFFKAIRHNQSFYYQFTQAEYESEITRACKELKITHVTHKPFQPQSKGKIERIFRFIQERLISQFEKQKINNLDKANVLLWRWMNWYHEKHVNRTTGLVPKKRFDPKGFAPLSGSTNLDDIFCFKDTRKVDACNQFSYKGQVYAIPKEYCMVAYKITLHIHPHRFIRVWHGQEFICQLPMR